VARAVRFLVVSRAGHTYEPPPEARVDRIDQIDVPFSSSEIRRALAAGEHPRGVPAAVLEYAQSRRLYR
jgi:nicotinic acid mononucleotide adenylyltransferase